MRRLGTLSAALVALVPVVIGHTGHVSGSSGGGNPVFLDAVLTLGLNEIKPVQVSFLVIGAVLILVIGYDLYSGELWELPTAIAALLILLTASSTIGLFVHYSNTPEVRVSESFGPGMGPMHMEDYYTRFNVRNVKRLSEFRQLETVADITHPPDRLPDRITRNQSRTVNITLVAKEVVAEVANGSFYYYWTFNGTVPGPFLRVRENDKVRLTLVNSETSTHNHSIDLHAVTGPGGGAGVMGDVPPGERRTITFTAAQEGTYVYHCATDNVPTHIAQGMYGGIVVEPREGLEPVDREFVLFQGEVYTKSGMGADGFQQFSPRKMLAEEPTYFTFNGRVHGITGEDQMRARAGDEVRIFVGNMGNAKTMSFHVIGEIFDAVFSGEFDRPVERNAETTVIGAGQAKAVEITVERAGSYVPVDHALARLDRGAWGILNVTGEGRRQLLRRVR